MIYGGEEDDEEDSKEDSQEDEESGNADETMTADGVEYTKKRDVWVSEDGEEYIFPPGKDEDDYDLDELDRSTDSEGLDETRDEEGGEKEQKEQSLNQY